MISIKKTSKAEAFGSRVAARYGIFKGEKQIGSIVNNGYVWMVLNSEGRQVKHTLKLQQAKKFAEGRGR